MNNTQHLIGERIFDAPRESVWRAWTDPEWLMRWWGPEHFTSPLARMDVRPGGRFLWGMRDPDGNDYWTTGTFREVVPLERLVYTDSFGDEHGNVIPPSAYGMGDDFPAESIITVTFEDVAGGTRMRVYTDQKPEGDMGDMAVQGWNQSFDKLAASLPSSPPRGGDLALSIDRDALTTTITRAFDAPRELVWRAMTEPELLARWWGQGDHTEVTAYEFRPGGAWRFVQYAPDGSEHAFHGEFREIEPPSRIVQTFEYEPWAGHVLLETLTLTEHGGGTLLTAVDQYSSLEDLEGMVQSGMEAGAAESYRHLETLLRSLA